MNNTLVSLHHSIITIENYLSKVEEASAEYTFQPHRYDDSREEYTLLGSKIELIDQKLEELKERLELVEEASLTPLEVEERKQAQLEQEALLRKYPGKSTLWIMMNTNEY